MCDHPHKQTKMVSGDIIDSSLINMLHIMDSQSGLSARFQMKPVTFQSLTGMAFKHNGNFLFKSEVTCTAAIYHVRADPGSPREHL